MALLFHGTVDHFACLMCNVHLSTSPLRGINILVTVLSIISVLSVQLQATEPGPVSGLDINQMFNNISSRFSKFIV